MMFLSCCVGSIWGDNVNHAAQADKANRELQLLVAKLPVCRDSTYYYSLIEKIVEKSIECDSLDCCQRKGEAALSSHKFISCG